MPAPLPIDLDATIKAFEVICDRLSNVEEKTGVLFNHLRKEHMCKPSGWLDAQLLGLPLQLQYRIERESEDPDHEKNVDERPYLAASMVEHHCRRGSGTGCIANSLPNYYHPLYRRYFPEQADALIAYELDDNHTELAQCANYGIEATLEQACDEVESRAKTKAVNSTLFSADGDLQPYCYEHSVLLCANRRVEVRDHILQALRVFQAGGHTLDCMDHIILTPCAEQPIRAVMAALKVDRIKSLDEKKRSIQSSGRRSVSHMRRLLPYLEAHPELRNFTNEVIKLCGLAETM